MLLDAVEFWVEPSSGRSLAFFMAFVFLGGIIILVQLAHRHRIHARWEAEFIKQLRETGIIGKPEEAILRDLVERYKIAPPAQLLSSLAQYDEIASQEILRLETAAMALADRIDRIEYLYSIRIQAFTDDPAISGADVLLPKEETPPAPLAPAPEIVPAAITPLMVPLAAEGGSGPDLSLLFSDIQTQEEAPPSMKKTE